MEGVFSLLDVKQDPGQYHAGASPSLVGTRKTKKADQARPVAISYSLPGFFLDIRGGKGYKPVYQVGYMSPK
ncbi:MAG: hypothetical protein JW821_16360 [Deltaproteobacteria bacterium]|nr:hypothetical protein [Deltaproteobacteria bacterium]